MIWIFPLSEISSVIGGKYHKMYYHDLRVLDEYAEGKTTSIEIVFSSVYSSSNLGLG